MSSDNDSLSEGFKAGVHMGIFGLTVAALLYNLGSYKRQKERHHATNVVVYTILSGYEVYQVMKHVVKGNNR